MRVVIGGSSGLIGTALSRAFERDGHEVVSLVRREAKDASESRWDPSAGEIDGELLCGADVVVNLAGASIGAKRLTESYQQVVLRSRTDTTGLIARTLAAGTDAVWLQASAMGYYGDRGEEELHERSAPGDTFLSDIVTQWEASAEPAVNAGVRVVFSRTGLVLAPHGGFADRLLPFVTKGLLRSLGSGDAWHAWITLPDVVGALRFLVDSEHAGPANVIAPEATRDRDLIRALADAAGKPTLAPVPAWALRMVEGPAAEDLLGSQRATPGVLTRLGYQWSHPSIEKAAEYVMSAAGHAPPASPPQSM